MPIENNIDQKGLKQQKVVKEPIKRAALVAKRSGEVEGMGKPMLATRELEEEEQLKEIRKAEKVWELRQKEERKS